MRNQLIVTCESREIVAEHLKDSTGTSDRVSYTYNRQSQRTSLTDQNGSTRQYDFDSLGRQKQDRVTTLGAGVDGTIRRVEQTYDVRGNVSAVTCYNNASVGSGSIVNQITRQFDGFGQVTKTFQSHSGAVNPASTPSAGRSYTNGSGNVLRPTATLYPNGRVVTLSYGSSGSITDKMNQVSSLIDDDSTVLAAYQYLGLGTFVQQDSTQADLRYTLISPTLSTDPDTGDIYSGLDRFGRVKDVRWRDVSVATDLSRIEYGYDRASNRTWRENPSDPNREHDWLYRYDGLDRLQYAQRGQLNGTHTSITSLDAAQCWTLDPTGNWKEFRQDKNGDGTWDFNQTRTANQVNEITDISNTPSDIWATPAYDKNGNTTTNPRPDLGTNATMTATFDAWNRMTKLVDDSSSNVLLENQYDGRNFRVVAKEYASGTLARTREYYFTDSWQCVEEHVDTSNTPRRQYVWGMRYIDDLVLRDRDISPSGGLLSERLYYLADANWNTTAVVSASGSVQERYEYDPYGNLSIFAASFTPRVVSSYGVHYTYTSREWTPNAGLYCFRNRWYDAQLGRFSSRDPIGFDGSQWNAYEFVSSMALVTVDPFGLDGPRSRRQTCTTTTECNSTGNYSVKRGETYRGSRLGFSHYGDWGFVGFDWGITLLGSNVGASYWRRDKYYRFEMLQDTEVFLQFKCVHTTRCKCPDAIWTHVTYEKRKQWEQTIRAGTTTDVDGSEAGVGRAFCNHEGCTAIAPGGDANPRTPNPQTPVDTPLIPGGGSRR